MKPRCRQGVTRLEVVVSSAVIVILLCLGMSVSVGRAVEAQRKQVCSENLRKLSLAMMEYEQTFKRLISFNCAWGYGGYEDAPFWKIAPSYGGAGRWSGTIALLPFLEERTLYSDFHDGASGRFQGKKFRWGPYGSVADSLTASYWSGSRDALRYPWSIEYRPNRTQVSVFRCPSDPADIRLSNYAIFARTNYAFCLGDSQIGLNSGDPNVEQTRGAFQINLYHHLFDITDGYANTIMFGEIATPEKIAIESHGAGVRQKDARIQGRAVYELDHKPDFQGIDVLMCRALASGGRYPGYNRNWGIIGTRAYDALATYTGFNTINAPNAGSCTPTSNAWGEGEGIYTATAYHYGGAHVATFDGSVKFVHDGISTQDHRAFMTGQEYYAPGRTWDDGSWKQTPNWKSGSPFGVWGAMGTISAND